MCNSPRSSSSFKPPYKPEVRSFEKVFRKTPAICLKASLFFAFEVANAFRVNRWSFLFFVFLFSSTVATAFHVNRCFTLCKLYTAHNLYLFFFLYINLAIVLTSKPHFVINMLTSSCLVHKNFADLIHYTCFPAPSFSFFYSSIFFLGPFEIFFLFFDFFSSTS